MWTKSMERLTVALVGVIALSTICFNSIADDAPQPQLLQNAFQSGAGDAEVGPVQVLFFGNNLLLSTEHSTSLECILCSNDEAITKAYTLGVNTAAKVSELSVAHLHLNGFESGVRLFIDGVPVAPVGTAHPLLPGEHTVSTGEDECTIEAEENEEIAITANELSSVKIPRLRQAIAVGGLGATAIVIGALLLPKDGTRAEVIGTDNNGDDLYKRHTLKGAGITMIVTGIVSELLLIWLLQPERTAHQEEVSK